MRPLRKPAFLLGLLLSLRVAAQEPVDWIDEFPTVTAVAQVAIDEYEIELAGVPTDFTWVAANLAATFTVLREIIELKQREEWFMSNSRKEKVRQLIAAYQEAELTTGRGWLARAMMGRSFPNELLCRAGDETCYRQVFEIAIDSRSGSASYRERFLRRLFPCGTLASELNELRQNSDSQPSSINPFYWFLPHFESPAHTLVVEGDYLGVGPVGCEPYGGDANGDGLCDDWKPAARSIAPGSRGASTRADGTCIELTHVLMTDSGGLKIGMAEATAVVGKYAELRVDRAVAPDGTGSTRLWQGLAMICERGKISPQCPGLQPPTLPKVAAPADPGGDAWPRDSSTWPFYAIIPYDAGFAPPAPSADPEQTPLYLLVDTVPPRKPVHCEQPSQAWLQRQVDAATGGLHGPYSTRGPARAGLQGVDAALLQALFPQPWQKTYEMTTRPWIQKEHGLLVLQKIGSDGLYVTPPVESSQFGFWTVMWQPLFPFDDYYRSFRSAFTNSCESEDGFAVYASVHSHPASVFGVNQTRFSATDFQGSDNYLVLGQNANPQLLQWGAGRQLWTLLQRTVLFDSDRLCLHVFARPSNFKVPTNSTELDEVNKRDVTRYCPRL